MTTSVQPESSHRWQRQYTSPQLATRQYLQFHQDAPLETSLILLRYHCVVCHGKATLHWCSAVRLLYDGCFWQPSYRENVGTVLSSAHSDRITPGQGSWPLPAPVLSAQKKLYLLFCRGMPTEQCVGASGRCHLDLQFKKKKRISMTGVIVKVVPPVLNLRLFPKTFPTY